MVALQAAQQTCHAPCTSITSPVVRTREVWSADRGRRGKKSGRNRHCQTRRALLAQRVSNCQTMPMHNCTRGSPFEPGTTEGSTCVAEESAQCADCSLSHCLMRHNNVSPGFLLQRGNAVQSQEPGKFSQAPRQKTGTAGAGATPGAPSHGHPIALRLKRCPKTISPQNTMRCFAPHLGACL